MAKYFSLPFAVAGDKSITPDALQPDGSVSYTEGFTPDYALPNSDPDYRPIPRAGYNGLMFDITEAIKQVQERSILTWRNDVEYTAGASVIGSDGFYYKAAQSSGPSTAPRDPVTQASYWRGPSDIRKPPITVDAVSDMIALTGLANGSTIIRSGYYAANDCAPMAFRFIASGSPPAANGVTIFHDDAATGYFEAGDIKSIDALCAGIVLDGSDQTAKVQAVADLGISLIVGGGVLGLDSVALGAAGTKITVMPSASILALTPSVANEAVITLNAANCVVEHFESRADLDETDRALVSVLAADCVVRIKTENASSSATSNNSVGSLVIGAGGDRCRFRVDDINAVNNGNSNGSTPRAVSIQGAAIDAWSEGILKRDGDGAAVVTSDGTSLTIDGWLWTDSISDNMIYNIGGTVRMKACRYSGDEEGIVNEGSLYCDFELIEGRCIQAAANDGRNYPTDNPYMWVGHIHLNPPLDSNNVIGAVIGIRSGNVNCDTLHVGKITGRMLMGNKLCDFNNGLIQRVRVDSIDLDIYVDTATQTPVYSDFANFSGASGVHCTDWNIRIIDVAGTLTSTERFQVTYPTTNLSALSTWSNCRLSTLSADETTQDAAQVRIVNIKQQYVRARGVEWENTGATVRGREYGYNGGQPDSFDGAAVPVTNYFELGQDYVFARRTTAPFRFRCTATGTPGTLTGY